MEQLYRRFAPFVHARATRILGRDADAVVRELFVRLVATDLRAHDEDDKKVTAWILANSTELALARLRRGPPDDADWERQARTAAQGTENLDDLLSQPEFCRPALADLDRRTQEVVVLVHLEGLTAVEAAAALHISAGVVEEELQRFRDVAGARLAAYRRSRPGTVADGG